MTLHADLENKKQESVENIPVQMRAQMEQAIDELRTQNILENALKTGDKVPDFTLPDATGNMVTLSTVLEKGPVVLTVYRGGWCPYCNLELRAYQNALSDIEQAGGQLVALSPETPDNSLSTSQKNELSFTVLSDPDHGVLRAMGLVFTMPDYLVEIYNGFGLHVDEANGTAGKFELPISATYLIDTDRTIKLAHLDEDYKERLEPSDVVEALKAL